MAWTSIVHDCPTPDLKEIEEQEAQVDSEWECDTCKSSWKLRQKISKGGRGIDPRLPDWQRLTINGEEIRKNVK